ncbi:glucan endo-1,3-beta-glucosidase, acidic isoform-like [Elaeis guineensis]|uniref:glucan endo-1,3-beta-glucosidase, acidic isoform-like n=1 Tax=Elaeis guineensis var. tenera TaxID=51953 RepID=UPI003C6CCCB7
MQNLNTALTATKLNIPVSTAIATDVFDMPFLPFQGAFFEALSADMTSIAGFLPKDVQLDYVLFTATSMVVVDGSLNYANLFDAMYSALEKARHTDVSMVVSETGWPSTNGAIRVMVENAMTYNNNAVAISRLTNELHP